MARKNARRKRRAERKIKYKTYDEAYAALMETLATNYRQGHSKERNSRLQIYKLGNHYYIGHNRRRK